jgi:diguanylate cyclase (GGDEF)-like protein/PAS domain S-box-containing protein
MPFQGLDPGSYKVLLDELYDGVYFVDTHRRIQYWNKAAEELTGYSASEMVSRFCYDKILCHTDDSGHELCEDGCPLQRSMDAGEKCKADVYLKHKQGQRVSVSVRAAPIKNRRGKVVGAIEVFLDNSSKKKLQRNTEELNRIAYYDSLTGLVNRRYLEMRLEQAQQEFQSFGRPFAVILFDLDHFKLVNDSCGHHGGDIVLAHVAQLFANNLRANDTVGRWGGEEFLAILPDIGAERTKALAERCRGLVSSAAPSVDGKIVTPTVSAGVAVFRTGDEVGTMMRRADEALYRSKSNGRNCVTAVD